MAKPKVRPLSRKQWLARQDRGDWTYERYVRWFNRNVAGKYAPKAPPFPGYMGDRDLVSEARRIVDTELQPSRQEIARLRDEESRRFGQQSRDISGFAQASAEMVRPIAGEVRGGYERAAGMTADFAKGFSIGMQAELGKNAETINADLAKFGAPAGQMVDPSKAEAARNVLYGETGAIPATSLAREGAAFGAAAAFLPQVALERGRIDLSSARRESDTRLRDLDRLVADLEARRPGLVSEALRELRDDQVSKRAAFANEQYLLGKGGLDAQNTALSARKTIADITGVDPVTGKPTAKVQLATTKAAQAAADKKAKASRQGVKAREDAFTTARNDIFEDAKGFVTEKNNNDPLAGLPGHPLKVKVKTPYKQAYQTLWNQYAPSLLRYATGAGKAQLRKRIKQIIDQALSAQGITPEKPARPKPYRQGPPRGRRPARP